MNFPFHVMSVSRLQCLHVSGDGLFSESSQWLSIFRHAPNLRRVGICDHVPAIAFFQAALHGEVHSDVPLPELHTVILDGWDNAREYRFNNQSRCALNARSVYPHLVRFLKSRKARHRPIRSLHHPFVPTTEKIERMLADLLVD